MKSPIPLAPTAIFNDFPKGLVAQCIIVGESSETHEASTVPFGMSSHSLPLSIFLPPHDARVPPVGKGRVV